jgi:hypothetical protein
MRPSLRTEMAGVNYSSDVVDWTAIAAIATGVAALATACAAGATLWMAHKTSDAAQATQRDADASRKGSGSVAEVGGGDRRGSLAGPSRSRPWDTAPACRPSSSGGGDAR